MKHKGLLAVYSVTHFAVDLSCAFLVYRAMIEAPAVGLALLLYNFCAFALQMPMGLLADGWNRNGIVAAAGCAVVALGYLPMLPVIPAAVIAGVGNGLFHVGGGLDVLNDSTEKASALGIFVSPGAFGLYLGRLLGDGGALPLWIPAAVCLLLGGTVLAAVRGTYGGFASLNAPAGIALSKKEITSAVLLFLVVVLRSYMGFNQYLPWKAGGRWALLGTAVLVLGKAAGGFAGDRWGMMKAAAILQAGAAVCCLFSQYVLTGALAVFLFNTTMPITLWAAAKLMPGGKGFAFGLLTFGLFLGYLPTAAGIPSLMTAPAANALAAVLSGALLLGALKAGEAA